jgi:hypothetical protein
MARTRKPPAATPDSLPKPRLIRRARASAPDEPATVPHEAIALQAYWLFLERGRVHGHDLDDWLTAERELLEPRSAAMARRAG